MDSKVLDASTDESNFDKSVLYELIRVHKMQAIVERATVITHVPLLQQQKRALWALSQWQKKRKFSIMGALLEIQVAHKHEGILVLPYKGLVIGAQFYGDVFQRDFNDLDFAIEKADLKRSAGIMKKLGYQEYGEASNFHDLKKSRSYHIDYSWVKRNDTGEVLVNAEFHWQPANSALFTPTTFVDLEGKVYETSILSKVVKTFSPVDNVLYISIHHGLVDGWMCLRHLVDFSLALKKLSSEDQRQLHGLIKKAKITKCFFIGVYLSEFLFESTIWKLDHRPNFRGHELYVKAFLKSSLVGKWSKNKTKLFYYLMMRDNLADRLKSISDFSTFAFRDLVR